MSRTSAKSAVARQPIVDNGDDPSIAHAPAKVKFADLSPAEQTALRVKWARKAQAGRTPEQRRAAALKASAAKSPEARRAAAAKAHATMGAAGRQAAARKAAATLAAKRLVAKQAAEAEAAQPAQPTRKPRSRKAAAAK